MAYKRHPDAELLQAALVGYQHQDTILAERIAALARELGGKPGRFGAAGVVAKPRRTMSAAARRRIGAAQRKRWAEAKKATGTPGEEGGQEGEAQDERCRPGADRRGHAETLGSLPGGESRSGEEVTTAELNADREVHSR